MGISYDPSSIDIEEVTRSSGHNPISTPEALSVSNSVHGSNAVKSQNVQFRDAPLSVHEIVMTPTTEGTQRVTHSENSTVSKQGDGVNVRSLVVRPTADDDSSTDLGTDNEDGVDVSKNSSEAELSRPVHDERVPAVGSMVVGRETEAIPEDRSKGMRDTTLADSCDHAQYDDSKSDDEDQERWWEYPEAKLSEEDRDYGVDPRDVGTSDSWVKRHPSLIRLTGRHPFNCEAPLPKLMAQGFLTPTNLHYVRNHGYVPQGTWDEWTIEVCGRVRRPVKLTMKDLLTKFPQREFPATLVCAGNRRMEQNLTAQTIGFNWGAAGLSTSVWKGVRLCEILRYCGAGSKKKGAAFVCFEGAETLPAGGGTRYGTSVAIDVALDAGRDVLVAYQQNGKQLDPDHGYPVRMIVPGHIGGRMVKWLTKIEVTPKESFNYYHFNDNRVLPSHVDPETAKAEGWWYKPDYIINELNINSAITTPAHDEVLPFVSAQKPYIVKGYAYTGGGRKVIRVELSLDAGATWRLCDVTYNEKPTDHGKYWCWVLWQLDVDVTDFLQSKQLVVRAWDAAMNTQPEHLTWNVMGMMNNCWFRVKVEACKTSSGSIGLKFQHPTFLGKPPGGWMYAEKAAKTSQGVESVAKTQATINKSSSPPGTLPQIPMSEVQRHNDSQSAWIVVHGTVYDCTPFLKDHPGGADSILLTAGTDATEEFDGIHSEKAKAMLEKYKVGTLAPESIDHRPSDSGAAKPENSVRNGEHVGSLAPVPEKASTVAGPNSSSCPIALNPRDRINFPLIQKETLSADVRKLRFALQSKDHVLGLPIGKHVLVAGKVNTKLVMRAYTPTSCDKDVGYFDLLVKVYSETKQFPGGGLLSQHLDSLKIGDSIGVKGPVGHIHYQGRGTFKVDGTVKFAKEFAMVAGGTGITPMYQVIRAILEDPEDQTRISLIYCNRTEDDIMLKNELDRWQEKHANFNVWYTLTGQPREGWAYSTGRITEQMMKERLPCGGSVDTFAFFCGPPKLESLCYDRLERLGYNKENCMSF